MNVLNKKVKTKKNFFMYSESCSYDFYFYFHRNENIQAYLLEYIKILTYLHLHIITSRLWIF